jgi:hypothetical protein
MAQLEISVEALPDIIQMLAHFCTIVGSADSSGPGTVTLIVEGSAVPFVDKVTCIVTESRTRDGAALSAKFEPVTG